MAHLTTQLVTFIDGENLTVRFEAMLADGRHANRDVVHEKGVFVWHPSSSAWNVDGWYEMPNANYYTHVVGDEERLIQVRSQIKTLHFNGDKYCLPDNLRPNVFKKLKTSFKTRAVDIQMTIDILRAAKHPHVGAIGLLSGDGDFLRVIDEIHREGKLVFGGAFSSGLNDRIPLAVDRFIDLDQHYFAEAPAVETRT